MWKYVARYRPTYSCAAPTISFRCLSWWLSIPIYNDNLQHFSIYQLTWCNRPGRHVTNAKYVLHPLRAISLCRNDSRATATTSRWAWAHVFGCGTSLWSIWFWTNFSIITLSRPKTLCGCTIFCAISEANVCWIHTWTPSFHRSCTSLSSCRCGGPKKGMDYKTWVTSGMG